MDALELGDLVRVASASTVLHELFLDAVVKRCMDRCRVDSDRANLSHFALDEAVETIRSQRDFMDLSRRVNVLVLDQKDRRIRELEQALADSQRELASVKRARKD